MNRIHGPTPVVKAIFSQPSQLSCILGDIDSPQLTAYRWFTPDLLITSIPVKAMAGLSF
jgi:hypothetical protein